MMRGADYNLARMSGMLDLSIARWFKAWVERRRDDVQGGLQFGEDVGYVGLFEG